MRTANKLIDSKIGLPQLAESLNTLSVARNTNADTDAFDETYRQTRRRKLAVIDVSGRLAKKRIDCATEEMILTLATQQPLLGQQSVSDELRRRGISAAASTVYGIWQRHNLETFVKRINALENLMAEGGIDLSEAQLAAIRKKKDADVKNGKLQTLHPGYLGTQDTYCPGSVKGLGKIYQQTFVDTFSKMAFVKVYDCKDDLVTADLLNDRVVPFYDEQRTPLLKILTDRGTEYCGSRERHRYQLYLRLENIEHCKTETKDPQVNGMCDNFHRVMQDEFYSDSFWDKTYNSPRALQEDIDSWLHYYNKERILHNNPGLTPFQFFEKGKQLIKQVI